MNCRRVILALVAFCRSRSSITFTVRGALLATLVNVVDVEGLAALRVEPALLDCKRDEVGRAARYLSGCFAKSCGTLQDVAWVAHADVIRTHALGDPQPLATRRKSIKHPALVRIGKEMRVAAVVGVAVGVDQARR